ncbi:MAG: hypothetical protein R2724_28960 [Bryobacterales bacterium]
MRSSPATGGVLFFCRGRGRGHAVPDLEIAAALRAEAGDALNVQFVSYSTGASVLMEAGETVIRLDLPDQNPYLETLVPCAQIVGSLAPDLVVSHEEFVSLPAAKIFGVPTLFLTDWFADDPDLLIMRALKFADEIVFLEREGLFEPPPYARAKVHYVGPIVRPMAYARGDRERARQELGLPADARLISVIPGAWATEERTPLWDLMLAAFDALETPANHLVWIAGQDAEELSGRAAGRDDVTILASCDPIERLMAASDLGITKGNRGTTLDLQAMGVRSVSISFRTNPVDDHMVPQIPTNKALCADETDPAALASELTHALRSDRPMPDPLPPTDAAKQAALRILHRIEAARVASA